MSSKFPMAAERTSATQAVGSAFTNGFSTSSRPGRMAGSSNSTPRRRRRRWCWRTWSSPTASPCRLTKTSWWCVRHGGVQSASMALLVCFLFRLCSVCCSSDSYQFEPRFRCLKHWLKGKKTGETEVFIDNLPGGPDNIKLAPDGSFWIAVLQVLCLHSSSNPPSLRSSPRSWHRVALFQLRSKGMDLLHRSPTAKTVVAAFPKVVKALQAMGRGAMVVNVGSDGKIRRMLDDSDGKVMSFVTSAMEFQGYLYLGSLHSNFVGKLTIRSDHPLWWQRRAEELVTELHQHILFLAPSHSTFLFGMHAVFRTVAWVPLWKD